MKTSMLSFLMVATYWCSVFPSANHAISLSRILRRKQCTNNKTLTSFSIDALSLKRNKRMSHWGLFRRRTTMLSSTTEETSKETSTDNEIASCNKMETELSEKHHQRESTHLQLNMQENPDTVKNTDENDEEQNTKPEKKVTLLLSYEDPNTKEIWNGLGVSRRRFAAWLNYTLEAEPKESMISSSQISTISKTDRDHLRRKWSAGRLICDRTGDLTVYKSDSIQDNTKGENEDYSTKSQQKKGTNKNKRGGFSDLLHLYTERFQGILRDEQEETNGLLNSWLYHEYGINETQQLLASNFHSRDEREQLQILQHFLDWFRTTFPYFYDRCDNCGASFKEEPQDDDDGDGTFVGYVFPSEEELKGNAGRTELYQCHKCQAYTRFPRFNKVQAVLNRKRGRCGEYSMLIYRMLTAAGHEVRWVVDWSDHVWNEILLNGKKWIHLDPCEAAVDTPLLYQDWGKQQTYILGFSSPPIGDKASNKHKSILKYPKVEDLTKKYTSDTQKTIDKRREESPREFAKTLKKTTGILRKFISKDSLS